jgi:hypothetical protein
MFIGSFELFALNFYLEKHFHPREENLVFPQLPVALEFDIYIGEKLNRIVQTI